MPHNNIDMRQLASIQKISKLSPIPDADAIEVAQVLGWHVVVKKGQFNVGDLVIYCEIDSVLPQRDEFEFLASKRYRIRTIRLRKQISQGICFPLSLLPEGKYNEGDDVTKLLGVVKYEAPIPAQLQGTIKGPFPSFIPKTDETRVQNLQKILDQHVLTKCYITEKLDGSSMTCYLKDDEFGVCSRNMNLLETEENTFWKVAREIKLEEKLRSLPKGNYAIQGELVGEGIQGNKYGLRGHTFIMFNFFDIDTGEYCGFYELMGAATALGLETVPVLHQDYLLSNNIDDIVEMSKGRSVIGTSDCHREGIVIRPIDEKQILGFGRMSFKAINPDFLLKYE